MTTTVRISIQGNKAVEVLQVEGTSIVNRGKVYPYPHSHPAGGRAAHVEIAIHGDQRLEVRETGDFLT